MVVFGIAGELVFEGRSFIVEDQESERAIGARLELEKQLIMQGPRWIPLTKATPHLIKQLSPFAGQKVDVFRCGSVAAMNGEVRRTFDVVDGDILSDAKWKINNHAADPPMDNCSMGGTPGIMILISPKASSHVRDAANVLTTELRKVIPSSVVKTMPMEPPPLDSMPEILKQSLNEQHPSKLLARDAELIVIFIEEHPGE
jgi:hypothetical protein